MLEFFYDCISKYFIEDSFELTETDTDSIYMAINQASIDECIRSSHHDRYQKEIFKSCSDEKVPPGFLEDVASAIWWSMGDMLVVINGNGRALRWYHCALSHI